MYFSLLIILTCMLCSLFVKESTSSQELNRLTEENNKVREQLHAKMEENNHLKEELAKTMEELTTLKEVNEIHNVQQQSVSVEREFLLLLYFSLERTFRSRFILSPF